jgi:hypothetical protein
MRSRRATIPRATRTPATSALHAARHFFDEQFRKGIATLKPGEISEPFETRFRLPRRAPR